MMARLVIYLYVVMLGIMLLVEHPLQVAVGP